MKKWAKKFTALIAAGMLAMTVPVSASAAWKQNESKQWIYTEASGNATGWRKIDSVWYHFDQNGIMQTGWIQDSGTWYYLSASGAMKTGWLKDGGKWYYLDGSGAMQTGWQEINGKSYYFLHSSGEMLANALIDGIHVDASGAADSSQYNPVVSVNGFDWEISKDGIITTNISYTVNSARTDVLIDGIYFNIGALDADGNILTYEYEGETWQTYYVTRKPDLIELLTGASLAESTSVGPTTIASPFGKTPECLTIKSIVIMYSDDSRATFDTPWYKPTSKYKGAAPYTYYKSETHIDFSFVDAELK